VTDSGIYSIGAVSIEIVATDVDDALRKLEAAGVVSFRDKDRVPHGREIAEGIRLVGPREITESDVRDHRAGLHIDRRMLTRSFTAHQPDMPEDEVAAAVENCLRDGYGIEYVPPA
jgi:hypothetical protein